MRQGEAISSKCLLTTYGKSNMKVICNLFFFFHTFMIFILLWCDRDGGDGAVLRIGGGGVLVIGQITGSQ